MERKINLENFKTIMDLREAFAHNRKKDKIEIIDHHFGWSAKLTDIKHSQRLEVMKVNDSYREKDFGRKVKLLNIPRK